MQIQDAKCNKCHKVGHLARACYRPVQPRRQDQGVKGQHTGQSNKGHVRQVSNNPSEQVADIVTIYTVTEGLPRSYKVIMEVNKQPIEMELDTGAIVSLMSEVTWTRQLHKPELKPCSFVLKGYPNNKLDILGCIKYKSQLEVLLSNYHLLSAREMGCHCWAEMGWRNFG